MNTKQHPGRGAGTSEPEDALDPSGEGQSEGAAPVRRIAQVIEYERLRRGLSYEELAEEIGFTSHRYLFKLQRGVVDWGNAGLDRLRLVAKWLQIAPVEAFKLADVITLDDFIRQEPGEDGLDQLLHRMSLDPRYSIVIDQFQQAKELPRWAKYALLVTYQELTGRMLLATASQLRIEDVDLEKVPLKRARKRPPKPPPEQPTLIAPKVRRRAIATATKKLPPALK